MVIRLDLKQSIYDEIKKAAPIMPISSGSLPTDGREYQRHIIGFTR
jgi:hypothetical protein